MMNFVPGEEREGKMRIIHKEQVVVTTIIVKSCIKISSEIIVGIVCT